MTREQPSWVGQVGRSVLSYGGVYLLIAVSAIVRIPLVVSAIGQDRFGLVNVIGGMAPLFLASVDGLRSAARTLAAEERGRSGTVSSATIHGLVRAGRRTAVTQAFITTALVSVLPLRNLLNGDAVVSQTEFLVSVSFAAVACALACPGGVRWGLLEEQGRIVLVNSFFAGTTVVGLALTVAASRATDSFTVFTIVNLATSVAPFYCPFLFYRVRRHLAAEPVGGIRVISTTAMIHSCRALTAFTARAFDPFVISAALGPAAAASYTVAQRVAIPCTIVPMALVPYITSTMARRRGSGTAATLGESARMATLYSLVAGCVGLPLVVAGPGLVEALTGGSFSAPRGLFQWLAILGVVVSFQYGISATGTGPTAIRVGLFIDGGTALLNVVLSVWLVGQLGLVGPIVASVAASAIASLGWVASFHHRSSLLRELHPSPAL